MGIDVDFPAILQAKHRIAGGVRLTPCEESENLSRALGMRVFCKQEYRQQTGSFKERGARNALLQLRQQGVKGVVAASAGNHALALAFHARDLGMQATVAMPVFAPLVKQSRCQALGARVLLHGQNIGEAKERADQIARDEGLAYVHGFDDAAVIAGAGTVGLEILDQVPDVDAIVVPVGGAGLIAGLALAVKHLRPDVRVLGVEPEHAPSYTRALQAGEPVQADVVPTLGDGLAVPKVGERAFAIARTLVDDVTLVDENRIALAILRLLETERGVVEGAGAAPLAALLAGAWPELKGKNVVLTLCGGNIDPNILGRVIEHGLVEDGRLARFTATISDRPGGLAKLTALIAQQGASVKQILHERTFASADVSTVQVDCILETRDQQHLEDVLALLSANGIRCASRS